MTVKIRRETNRMSQAIEQNWKNLMSTGLIGVFQAERAIAARIGSWVEKCMGHPVSPLHERLDQGMHQTECWSQHGSHLEWMKNSAKAMIVNGEPSARSDLSLGLSLGLNLGLNLNPNVGFSPNGLNLMNTDSGNRDGGEAGSGSVFCQTNCS